jgi:hypothetical protein
MTPAERQRRHRAKLREIVSADMVLAELRRGYGRATIDEKSAIRARVKKLLRAWEKDAVRLAAYWRRQRGGDRRRRRR